ncbi:hypothetical protein CVT25_010214 [Psilocybe cyanescens]|uniref:RlpA-like protein double-psi beta-barrel domain-containing protein n=1 Tax=Psilocybe cyanescens TaxID=93625 RepID=A0A409XCW0_PSICY|nr:hypothetical protein CVT25_010214 [Psilocybe cyanescens]
MSYSNILVLFLSFVVAANALATPNVVRHHAHHRAIAARVAVPEPLDIPALPLQRRQNNRRCKQRSSAINPPASTPASASVAPTTSKVVQVPATTVIPTPSVVPATTPKKEPTTPAPAPVPTTTKAPAPAPAPTTTKAPAPVAGGGSNLPSFMVGTQTGQGTFYATGLGACGITNKDTDHIAAVSHLLFDTFPGYNGVNPNNNPMCGRTVTATCKFPLYQGKSVVVALTDRCVGCAVTDLDFSPSAFNLLSDPSVGRISGMTWVWND